LLNSKQLAELVNQAQVDEKSKLQLRFYARQFIDAMSPSNFPATNPDVIRTAIQTRSASPGGRDAEPDRGSAKGADHPGSTNRLLRSASNLATTPWISRLRERADSADPIYPANERGRENAAPDRAACINKYYLLDLGAGNSFVEYAVGRGHQVS
jgi:polyhydroxyalkanoate synthase